MRVYKYWAEPVREDLQVFRDQLRLASDYARVLAQVENRARVLARAGADRETVATEQAAAARWAYAQARAAGLAWGTCLQSAAAAEHSRRTTPLGEDVRERYPRDEGVLAVQIQDTKPLAAADLVGGADTRARVGADLVARREGGARRLRVVQVRVGTRGGRGEGRAPVWMRLHTLMHRPLGEGQVKWVLVCASRCGPRTRWSLQVVVDEAGSISAAPSVGADASVRSSCGLDIGWRRMPDGGVRVAYWIGSDGREGELRVPAEVVARDGKSDDLRSIRDRDRDIMQARLRDLRARPGVPAWFAEATATLHAWKRMGRYVHLAGLWRQQRWPGDEDAWRAVEVWLRHDRHLWAWEANNRRRQSLQVAGRVRHLAVDLARRYRVVAVERAGVVPALVRADKKHGDEERAMRRNAARKMHACSPALVRRELAWLTRRYGSSLLEVDPAYTTRDCAECGHRRDEVEDWAPLEITCPRCAVVEDQDRTAARNLLASALAPPAAGEPLAPSVRRRKMPARRTRRRAREALLASGGASAEDHGTV